MTGSSKLIFLHIVKLDLKCFYQLSSLPSVDEKSNSTPPPSVTPTCTAYSSIFTIFRVLSVTNLWAENTTWLAASTPFSWVLVRFSFPVLWTWGLSLLFICVLLFDQLTGLSVIFFGLICRCSLYFKNTYAHYICATYF